VVSVFRRALVESPLPTTLTSTGDGRILGCNRQFEEMLGVDESVLHGQRVEDLVHPDDQSLTTGVLDRLSRGESTLERYEARWVRPDGRVVWTRRNVLRVNGPSDDGTAYLVAVIEDLTALRLSQQLSSALVDIGTRIAAGASLDQTVQRLTTLAEARWNRSGCLLTILDREHNVLRPIGLEAGTGSAHAIFRAEEEKARKEAEEKARREAEERAKREPEQPAQRQAELAAREAAAQAAAEQQAHPNAVPNDPAAPSGETQKDSAPKPRQRRRQPDPVVSQEADREKAQTARKAGGPRKAQDPQAAPVAEAGEPITNDDVQEAAAAAEAQDAAANAAAPAAEEPANGNGTPVAPSEPAETPKADDSVGVVTGEADTQTENTEESK
jgi:PAS domain S-box-containing protein